jgi:hypothetical protein
MKCSQCNASLRMLCNATKSSTKLSKFFDCDSIDKMARVFKQQPHVVLRWEDLISLGAETFRSFACRSHWESKSYNEQCASSWKTSLYASKKHARCSTLDDVLFLLGALQRTFQLICVMTNVLNAAMRSTMRQHKQFRFVVSKQE